MSIYKELLLILKEIIFILDDFINFLIFNIIVYIKIFLMD